MSTNSVIGIIGLGYVGLPLACLFATKHRVIGFDTKQRRLDELSLGIDHNGEIESDALLAALGSGLTLTSDPGRLADCNFIIVAVPTPVDYHNRPVFGPLESASRTVGRVIQPGATVVYESTVYPGVTEEVCVPIIERESGLKLNRDFFVGYSPERINPGDKVHTVDNIVKITSGSTPEAAANIDALYNSVLKNGTYMAPSIRVAEAAKVVENTQRDVNIALMNEVEKIFHALKIDTFEVIKAASTKWNFHPYKPGLVGGHCISVDPYYLIEQAKRHGLRPGLLSEARRINDTMPHYFAERIINRMNRYGVPVKGARFLILGFSYKANTSDIRNTKVIDIYNRLRTFSPHITVLDPHVSPEEVMQEHGVAITSDVRAIEGEQFDVIVHAVDHDYFLDLEVEELLRPGGFIYGVADRNFVKSRSVKQRR